MIYKFAQSATQDVLTDLRSRMSAHNAERNQNLMDMARGYGWGRIDSPGYTWPDHGGDALDFAISYAIHAAGPKGFHAVRDAFNQWHKIGEITNG